MTATAPCSLRSAALQALCVRDPAAKSDATRALYAQARGTPGLGIEAACALPHRLDASVLPGRPARPPLVHPARVPRRSPHRPAGLAALLHAIASAGGGQSYSTT
ncbi:MAG: hypothetical protein ACO248_09000, partial [Burkholderiaceae bacterium]